MFWSWLNLQFYNVFIFGSERSSWKNRWLKCHFSKQINFFSIRREIGYSLILILRFQDLYFGDFFPDPRGLHSWLLLIIIRNDHWPIEFYLGSNQVQRSTKGLVTLSYGHLACVEVPEVHQPHLTVSVPPSHQLTSIEPMPPLLNPGNFSIWQVFLWYAPVCIYVHVCVCVRMCVSQ